MTIVIICYIRILLNKTGWICLAEMGQCSSGEKIPFALGGAIAQKRDTELRRLRDVLKNISTPSFPFVADILK